MRYLGTLVLIAMSAACSTQAYDGGDRSRADEVATDDAPTLAASYGYVVNTTMVACSTHPGEDECKNDERKNVGMIVRGLAATSQDGARADFSFSGCRINVNWNGDEYDETKYLNRENTLRELGEIARISGVFVEGASDAPEDAPEDVPEDEETRSGESDGAAEAPKSRPVFTSGLSALLIGARLSDPIAEDMPTSKRDDRAFDHDGDRRAGISAQAPIGKVYLGARVVFDLPLALAEDGSLQGSLEAAGFDLSVYDDSIPFVDAEEKVDEALSKLKVLSMEHTVTLVPGYTGCDQVLEEL